MVIADHAQPQTFDILKLQFLFAFSVVVYEVKSVIRLLLLRAHLYSDKFFYFEGPKLC